MEEKKIVLSVALAVYNEEQNLSACLSSVKDIAGEIVVVDGGSGDKTVELAKSFGARVIETTNPPIFHINKQKALEACRGEWILQLDADEVIPEDLRSEIVRVVGDKQTTVNGFYIARKNFFLGRRLKKGGQFPDYVIRLVRRGKARFPQKSVHEQIIVDGEVGYLKAPMLHYTYKTRAEYWRKANAYTALTAHEFVKPSFFTYCFVKPVATFFSLYIRHKGFIDGLAGFEFALYSALHYPMAYNKYLKKI
jgi:glycosyltransferase involved in cell wall biosynthesis